MRRLELRVGLDGCLVVLRRLLFFLQLVLTNAAAHEQLGDVRLQGEGAIEEANAVVEGLARAEHGGDGRERRCIVVHGCRRLQQVRHGSFRLLALEQGRAEHEPQLSDLFRLHRLLVGEGLLVRVARLLGLFLQGVRVAEVREQLGIAGGVAERLLQHVDGFIRTRRLVEVDGGEVPGRVDELRIHRQRLLVELLDSGLVAARLLRRCAEVERCLRALRILLEGLL